LSNIVFTNSLIFFVKTFQSPREFTFEAILDGLKYKGDLKKNIFLRCLRWMLNWAVALAGFIELWTTRYIFEIYSIKKYWMILASFVNINKKEKIPCY